MRQNAKKPGQKFCSRKTTKKRKTHPEKAKKGETGCVLGAGGDENGCEQVRTDRKDRKARRNSWDGLVSAAASVGPGRSSPGCRPPRHAPQAGLRAHLAAKSYRTLTKKSGIAEAIPDFLAGAEGLEPSARGFGVDVGERRGERRRAGAAQFLTQAPESAVLVWCYGDFSRAKKAENPRKSLNNST